MGVRPLAEFIRSNEAHLRTRKLDRPPLVYVSETGDARDRPEGLWLEFGTCGSQRAIDVIRAADEDPARRLREFVGPDSQIIAHHVPVIGRAARVLV